MTTKPQGSLRPLQYPLNRSADEISDTPNTPSITFIDLSQWSTNDPNERIDVVINLSLNEYVALATAVDVGRDIAYGDNSIYIWWLWNRVVIAMDICQSIIDCIDNPESGVANAIIQLTGNRTYDQARDYAQAFNTKSLVGDSNPTCDDDILFGQCLQIVEYMNRVNEDILEIFEVLTNQLDMLADVIGDITLIDESSIDAGVSWIQFIQDNIAENYLAQVTESYKEAVACEMFCIARELNCELTPEIMYNVFRDRLLASVNITGVIVNLWTYLTAGSWAGSEIADFMFISQLGIRSMLGDLLGYNAYSDVETRLQIYANDPNSDWLLLCSCSGYWETTLDFETTSYATYFSDTSWGDGWVSTKGWQSETLDEGGGNIREMLYLACDFGETVQIKWVKLFVTATFSNFADRLGKDGYLTGRDQDSEFWRLNVDGDAVQSEYLAYDSIVRNMTDLDFNCNPEADGTWWISGIEIHGEGTKPSWMP